MNPTDPMTQPRPARATASYCAAPARPAAGIVWGTLLLATAGLAGCQSEAPVTGRAETYDHPWLTLNSRDLRANTRVGDARQARDESGILYVSVPVRNTSDKQLYVDYRVTFADRDGRELSEYRKSVTLPAFGVRNLEANSTSRAAETFQVELTYPRVN